MTIHTDIQWLADRRTKIIATLGPASANAMTICRLLMAGVNLFRVNMSHGNHHEHGDMIRLIRRLSAEVEKPVAILADLCGPKIRVGTFAGGSITLNNDEKVIITTRDVIGKSGLIPSQYPKLAADIAVGQHILLADGLMELKVEAIEGTEVHCVVLQGGQLSDHKGMNLPDTHVTAASLTDKDRLDAEFALGCGVDFLALSFVRTAFDVKALRALINKAGTSTGLVAKIERAEALQHIEDILAAADAIMVARGDLGVELPPEKVPMIQQALITRAREANKPVIIATQMLESMIDQIRPTRAEVSDVSHAVTSGADAIMLSAETAAGLHPVEAVEMMDRVARYTESSLWYGGTFGSFDMEKTSRQGMPVTDALAVSTAQLSRDLQVKCIIVISESGTSATAVSSARPAAPVIAITAIPATFRQMCLLWGVQPVLIKPEELSNKVSLARFWARTYGLVQPGDRILLVRWFHQDPIKNTPSITILNV
ncbi:pyruvate kinase [Mariprofundus erugo]|nr:pyruvate kinase [Mariprofundus erugo]